MLITAVFCELGVGGGTTELIQVEPADLELGQDRGETGSGGPGKPLPTHSK